MVKKNTSRREKLTLVNNPPVGALERAVLNKMYTKTFCFFSVKNSKRIKCFVRQKQPPEVFYKKGVLENFANFTEKHLFQHC